MSPRYKKPGRPKNIKKLNEIKKYIREENALQEKQGYTDFNSRRDLARMFNTSNRTIYKALRETGAWIRRPYRRRKT